MEMHLSDAITQYFWGDNLQELCWPKHKKYIIQTLLERGDKEALQWLFQQVSKSELYEILPKLTLQKKSRNFWQIYLS